MLDALCWQDLCQTFGLTFHHHDDVVPKRTAISHGSSIAEEIEAVFGTRQCNTDPIFIGQKPDLAPFHVANQGQKNDIILLALV